MRDFEAGLSGAQLRVAAGEVTMVIDEVRRIASKTMGDLTQQAGAHRSSFGGHAKVEPAAFGHVPKAQAFAAHQEAARQVFVDTYQGIIADLEAFRDNLVACADAHQANDESVQAGLLALSNRLSRAHLAADHDYRTSREEHRDGLLQGAQDRPQHEDRPTPQTGGAAHADAPSPHSFS